MSRRVLFLRSAALMRFRAILNAGWIEGALDGKRQAEGLSISLDRHGRDLGIDRVDRELNIERRRDLPDIG